MSWHLRGTYLEACNCEAICPCRRVAGQGGGRSTFGECIGALVRVERAVGHVDTVSCVIPGHDVPGTEVITSQLTVDTPAASGDFTGRCGFETSFAYAG